MSALPSLVALRQTLRAANTGSTVARAGLSVCHLRTQRLHSSTTASNQAAASSSASPSVSSSNDVPASEALEGLSDLHSQFEIDGEMYEMPSIDEGDFGQEGNLVAVPNKSSIVHVRLSRLRKPKAVVDSSELQPRKQYIPLSAHVFDAPARRDVIHSAVVWYLDSLRAGTANTKTRSEVRGSMRKLRPQKGSGRARLGTMSSPSLRGGAVAHGPKPRDHSTELPRRVRELALRSMLSSKWRQGELLVLPVLEWMPPPGSTNPLARLLKTKGWDDALFLTAPREPQPSERALIREVRPSSSDPVYEQEQRDNHQKIIRDFMIAAKSIPRIEVIELDKLTETYVEKVAKTSAEKKKPGELHAYQILRRRKLICDLGAIEWLEEKLGGAVFHREAGFEQLAEEQQQAADVPAESSAEQSTDTATSTPVAQTLAPPRVEGGAGVGASADAPTSTAEQEKLKAEQLTKQQAQAESSTQ